MTATAQQKETKARTGQWTGRIREQGPVTRRRGKLHPTVDVLEELEHGCTPPRVATWPLRDALFGEDWKTVRIHLGHDRSKRSNWLWNTAFEELANACWRLNRACHQRQARPVWAETPTKLAVITDLPTSIDEWLNTILLARRWPLSGHELRNPTTTRQLTPQAAHLGVLALFADATIDDVAHLCNTPRTAIYQLVWKHQEPTG